MRPWARDLPLSEWCGTIEITVDRLAAVAP
jgi:hypothetical protein